MNLYIGNLSFETTDHDLRAAFEAFGEVTSVNILTDKYSGKSRGFGFVEMTKKEEAEAAINGLNGKELSGRAINVSEARPRASNEGSGNRGGGREGDRGRNQRGGHDQSR